MEKINEAIILLGGMGTRMLPYTKTVSKEMIPIYDVPNIHLIVKECLNSGINRIIFVITKYNRKLIENYFTTNNYLNNFIKGNKEKEKLLDDINEIIKKIKFSYVYQQERGTYGALYSARKYIKGEAFALLYGDDLFDSKTPAIKQLIDKYNSEQIMSMGTIDTNKDKVGIVKKDNKNYLVDLIRSDKDINEIIIGRMILSKEVFKIHKDLKYSSTNELYLPQALLHHLKGKVKCYPIDGKYFNIGDKIGYIKASINYALKSSYKDELIDYIKNI